MLDRRINVHAGTRMLADLIHHCGGKAPDIAETRAHVQLVLELYRALLQDRQARHATGMSVQPAR